MEVLSKYTRVIPLVIKASFQVLQDIETRTRTRVSCRPHTLGANRTQKHIRTILALSRASSTPFSKIQNVVYVVFSLVTKKLYVGKTERNLVHRFVCGWVTVTTGVVMGVLLPLG